MDAEIRQVKHGMKITAELGLREITKSLKTDLASAPLCKLAQVTTHILKIHGLHLWKDDKTLNKTHVELTGISCTQ